jgi:hypothetical protein
MRFVYLPSRTQDFGAKKLRRRVGLFNYSVEVSVCRLQTNLGGGGCEHIAQNSTQCRSLAVNFFFSIMTSANVVPAQSDFHAFALLSTSALLVLVLLVLICDALHGRFLGGRR